MDCGLRNQCDARKLAVASPGEIFGGQPHHANPLSYTIVGDRVYSESPYIDAAWAQGTSMTLEQAVKLSLSSPQL